MQRKNVMVTDKHSEWLKKNHYSLSGIVQECLDNKMGDEQ